MTACRATKPNTPISSGGGTPHHPVRSSRQASRRRTRRPRRSANGDCRSPPHRQPRPDLRGSSGSHSRHHHAVHPRSLTDSNPDRYNTTTGALWHTRGRSRDSLTRPARTTSTARAQIDTSGAHRQSRTLDESLGRPGLRGVAGRWAPSSSRERLAVMRRLRQPGCTLGAASKRGPRDPARRGCVGKRAGSARHGLAQTDQLTPEGGTSLQVTARCRAGTRRKVPRLPTDQKVRGSNPFGRTLC